MGAEATGPARCGTAVVVVWLGAWGRDGTGDVAYGDRAAGTRAIHWRVPVTPRRRTVPLKR